MASDPVHQFAIDIGNSGLRVVRLGLQHVPERDLLRINWQLSASDSRASSPISDRFTPSDMAWTVKLKKIIDSSVASQVWISSVNRPAAETLVSFLSSLPHCEYHLIRHEHLPLKIEVDYPERVGIDRLLAALAALEEIESGSAIVIQAGSAVTVDLVTKQQPLVRRFLGGAIAPGVPMMLRLLGSAADLLPELDADDLVGLPPLPGKNTEAAMRAGVSSCLVGGVQHLVQRYRHAAKDQLPVVLSGGDGPLLAPHLPGPIIEVPHLVLRGIGIVALRRAHET